MYRCLHCSPNTRALAFSTAGFDIYDCTECGHRFVDAPIATDHVEKVYGDDYFFGGGDGYPDYLRDAEMLEQRGAWYRRWIAPHAPPQALVLDAGAAAGFLLRGLTRPDWTGVGVEPNAEMARYGRETLGLEMANTSLEAFDDPRRFDLVSCIQVLPHFYDLHAALRRIAELTKAGGLWLVETWNKDSITARVLKTRWHEYSPPSVLHWFSPRTLDRFARDYGFRRVALGRPSKRISAGHAKSLIGHKLSGTALDAPWKGLSKLIPNGALLPYPAEDLFCALFRKVN